MLRRPFLLTLLGAASAFAEPPPPPPTPAAETAPVPHPGDAADDPAVWLHPADPAKSLILGTDKQGGLIAYDLAGKPLQTVGPRSRPNNVDVLYDVPVEGGRTADIAVATTRGEPVGVVCWAIDPQTRALRDVTAGGVIRVLAGEEPYGLCTYHSARTGKTYFFANDKTGRVEQYAIAPAAGGTLTATRVRTLKLASIVEGCVADDEYGTLFVSEERKGIWRFSAEPDGAATGALIARVGENGLRADVEGLAIYPAGKGAGYLIASSQGNHTYKVYARTPDHAFVATIDPAASAALGKPRDTDGIAVAPFPLGPQFPKGVFIAQDGLNGRKKQNFKLFRWEDVAGETLTVDPASYDPRKPTRRE